MPLFYFLLPFIILLIMLFLLGLLDSGKYYCLNRKNFLELHRFDYKGDKRLVDERKSYFLAESESGYVVYVCSNCGKKKEEYFIRNLD